MKKLLIDFAAAILIFSVARSQQIVENPAEPARNNAGRVVKLERLLSIKDAGPDSPFRGPYDLQVGNDGSIYFYDNFEFFRFSPEGKFIFKVIRPGQGPGEAQMRTVSVVTDDQIIVQAWSPPKVMWFDLSSNLKDEKRTDNLRLYLSLFTAGRSVFGFREGAPPHSPEVKEGYIDLPTSLHEIAPDFQKQVEKISFPIENYVFQGGSAGYQSLFLKYAKKDEETLFISHTVDYKLVKYNLKLNRIEKTFRRRYDRIKLPPEKETPKRPGVLSPPPQIYYIDISALLIFKDLLWVITSTRDSKQCRLVDVYDMDGKYVDNFYLQFPEEVSHASFAYQNVAIRRDNFYSIDEEKDGTMTVNKYRILY
jgi:hypothetical protein